MRALIIGTAGHIDHGKSALVKALTGTDPDRLAEEQERGMTIDIGFAFLNENIAFIDVPGHERFIKNMVTGAATVGAAMLVVAADDGVMPQTREHLAILKLLGVRNGLIVINKIDLVKEDWLEMISEDVRQLVKGSFLQNAPIFKTSAVSGIGIAELRRFLLELPANIPESRSTSLFRLPIDRVFSVKGFGTVVTGTVLSGAIRVGDEVEIMPTGQRTKIRGIQSHNNPVSSISANHRTALNLAGVARSEVDRGMQIVTPGAFRKTDLLTVFLEVLPDVPPIKYNDRLRLHLDTGEYIVRIRLIGHDRLLPGTQGVAQIKFDQPVAAGFRERFVVRSYSPLETIGGGIVLENFPEPLRKKDGQIAADLEKLVPAGYEEWLKWMIIRQGEKLTSVAELARALTISREEIAPQLTKLLNENILREHNGNLIAADRFAGVSEKIVAALTEFHRQNPLLNGLEKATLYGRLHLDDTLGDWLVDELLKTGKLHIAGDKLALTGFTPQLNDGQTSRQGQILMEIAAAGLTPPTLNDLAEKLQIAPDELRQLINLLIGQQKVVLIDRVFPFSRTVISRAEEKIIQFLHTKSTATVSELKNVLGVSRKYAVPLLTYFDQKGVTVRSGDLRRLG
jgi:selenocysteine-specific elongation factor